MLDTIDDRPAFDANATAFSLGTCDFSTRTIPAMGAARGSDWCDAFPVSADVVALSIGDICGHGDVTHETMSAVRDAIVSAALHGVDPAGVLERANSALAAYDPDATGSGIVGYLNVRACTFAFANAGHPAPILTGVNGPTFLESPSADVPLGVRHELGSSSQTIAVPASSLLVLYTDGVTERERRPLQGMAQLLEAAIFAYHFSTPSARTIERRMSLTGYNLDDAALLTAWIKPLRDLDPLLKAVHA